MTTSSPALPKSLLSLYLEYKDEHQPRFVRWMIQKVWERKGHTNDQSTSSGGGNRKKKGHGSKRGASTPAIQQYKLKKPCPLPDPFPLETDDTLPRLNDLSLLSHFLSNLDPSEKVPESIIRLLESIIAGRKLIASHYQKSRPDQLTDRDRRHLHAINVFSDILELLKSCGPSAVEDKVAEGTDRVVAVIQYFSLRGSEATNLKPQSAPDEDPNDWIPAGHQLVTRKKLNKKQEREPASVPLSRFLLHDEEDDGFDDAMTAAFCFLQDAERLSNYVKELWVEYATRSITLVTATLVTNHALAILKESERTLLRLYKKFYATGDHNEILSVMMGSRKPLTKDDLIEKFKKEGEQGQDLNDLARFLRSGTLDAFRKFGNTLGKLSLPDNTAPAEADRTFALIKREMVSVFKLSDPNTLLTDEALFKDTRHYFESPTHLVTTHLLLQWDFWLHSLHACRKSLDRPCSTAVKTSRAIVAAGQRWLDDPVYAQAIDNTNQIRDLVKYQLVAGLAQHYDPESPPTLMLRRMYDGTGRRQLSSNLSPLHDLRFSPWAAGCLQVEALCRGHTIGLTVMNESGFLSMALQLYHGLRLHKQLEPIPFLDHLYTQCIPHLYGTSPPPSLGDLTRAHFAMVTFPGTGVVRWCLPQKIGTSFIAKTMSEEPRYSSTKALRERVATAQALPPTEPPLDSFGLLQKLKILYEKDLSESTLGINLFLVEDLAVNIYERWYTLADVAFREAFGARYPKTDDEYVLIFSPDGGLCTHPSTH